MDLNYDPLYPDYAVTDQSLSVWAQHRAFSNKPAFNWVNGRGREENSLSYSSLDLAASSIATHLRENEGLQRLEAIILVLYPPGLEFIEILFGCLRAGIAMVPVLAPDVSRTLSSVDMAKLENIVKDVKPAAVVSPSSYVCAFKDQLLRFPSLNRYILSNMRWISMPTTFGPPSPEFQSFQRYQKSYPGCAANDIYLVQYTSGATGPPKPTLITAGAAAHNARIARKAYDLNPSSVIVSWLPQYHDCGLMFIHLSVVTGATSILTSPFSFANKPSIWLEMLSDYKANCTPVPAFALPLVSRKYDHAVKGDLSSLNLSPLRQLIIINEPIEGRLVENFLGKFARHGLKQSAIAPSYGLAENCTFVCTAWAADSRGGQIPTYHGLLPSGRLPITAADRDEVDIRVVRPDSCKEAEEGEEGEIWLASPSNASGYIGMPQITRGVFSAKLADDLHSPQHKTKYFVRTGDTGVHMAGFLYITGRLHDQLLLNGRKVHPHMLETSVFESCSALRPGCAVAFSVKQGSLSTLVVLAELLISDKYPRDIFQKIHHTLLQEHGVYASTTVALLEARTIPKTTSGKLQRWKAKRLFMEGKVKLIESMSFGDNNKVGTARMNKSTTKDHKKSTKGSNNGVRGWDIAAMNPAWQASSTVIRSSL